MSDININNYKFQIEILRSKLDEYQVKAQNQLRIVQSAQIEHDLILQAIESIKNQINNINPALNPDNEGKNLLLEEKDNLVIKILSEHEDRGLTMPEVEKALKENDSKVAGKLLTIDELTGCRKRLLESGKIEPHPSCANKKRFVKYIVSKDEEEIPADA